MGLTLDTTTIATTIQTSTGLVDGGHGIDDTVDCDTNFEQGVWEENPWSGSGGRIQLGPKEEDVDGFGSDSDRSCDEDWKEASRV